MTIELKKFGTTLISRQSGKEALAAFSHTLTGIPQNEKVEIDFDGVITFSPSWGDEFFRPLMNKYNVVFKNATNPSVIATLKLLEKIHNTKFIIE